MTDNKSKRGFASMTPERRKEIAVLGGKASRRSRIKPLPQSEVKND